jgi:hypothetical protein
MELDNSPRQINRYRNVVVKTMRGLRQVQARVLGLLD